MNARMQILLQMVPADGIGLVDVGTDHAMLPIALAQKGYNGQLFATDIHEAPIQNALSNAANIGLSGRIHFLQCDGLDDCPPHSIDTIVIAGLGGDTICGILDRAEWLFESRYTLVLQPMQRAEVVRYWLIHNGFTIDREELAEENQHIFQMFRSVPGESPAYSDAEYICGKALNTGNLGLLLRNLELQCNLVHKKIAGLSQADETAESGASLAFFRNVLRELDEYRSRILSA